MHGATAVLKNVKFLVDEEGKTTAAVLDIESWKALLDSLEDAEDVRLARERLASWTAKRGWTAWEEAEREIDAR